MENLEEGMYKGKKLKDMSRQELYEAVGHMAALYKRELEENSLPTPSIEKK